MTTRPWHAIMDSTVKSLSRFPLRLAGRSILALVLAAGLTVARGESPDTQRAQFLAAEQALARGQLAEARQKAVALAGYPLQSFLLAKVLSRDPVDERALSDFLDRYGDSRYAGPVRRKWLDLLAAAQRWTDFLRSYKDSGDTALRCLQLWALLQTGQTSTAHAGAAEVWGLGEPAPASCERVFTEWRASRDYRPDYFWRRFAAALEDNRVDLAKELLPLAPDRGSAETWLRLHQDPKQVEPCGALNPDHPLTGDIFAHAVGRLAAKQPARAAALWNLRRMEYRINPEQSARQERKLALALAQQRQPEAAAYLAALPDETADSSIRGWRARAALALQDWPLTLAAIARLDAAEALDPAWRYWNARALERLGDARSAEALYAGLAGEREFHGFMAADRMARPYGLAFPPPAGTAAELERLVATPPFRAIAEFRALRRIGEAKREWADALDKLPREQLPLAAQLAAGWNWHRQAILALAKSDRREDLALRFPMAYGELVAQAAGQSGLDPALIYAVIRRESAFDPEARSTVGALGLMQLMPGTGQDMARKLRENWTGESNLLDPARNIRFGSHYFRGLLNRFGSHPALAAAGYNAGPGRAQRWQPKDGPLPADLWIETIPFTETRQYVMAVLSYATLYRSRLGHPKARIGELLPDIPAGIKEEEERRESVAVPACG